MPTSLPSSSSDPAARAYGLSTPSDLLVLGGGVLGLSTACEALIRGLRVTLFDETPERSATLASAGMLSPYAEPIDSQSLQEWMRQGRAAYAGYVARVEEASGCRVELRFPGTLLVTALEPGVRPAKEIAAARAKLEAHCARLTDMGANCVYLDPDTAAIDEPMLAAREAGAVLLEDEGYVRTPSLHIALRSAFQKLGGEWVPLHGLGLVVRQQRVVGVETAAGVVLGGAVLNATGAAAERFLLPEDVARYRPRPVRGQAARLRPPDLAHSIRRVIQAPGVGYLVPQADGSVVVGATSEPIGPFPGVTAGGVASVLASAERLARGVAEWSFVDAWSGLRPMAGDGEPSLVADSRPGLFHGLGLYRHGILLAPVAANRLVKMVMDYLGDARRA